MEEFLTSYSKAAYTTLGFFWSAFWAFCLGYVISSMIQVFVTKERMKKSMGKTGIKSVGLATFFGFISSSCSFAALATTKSLFKKGAGLIPSLAFLLASTNLVIELGIIIAIFLSWQFVIGEYLGGLLLIIFMWLFVKFTYPKKLVEKARDNLEKENESENKEIPDWKKLIKSKEGWQKVGKKYKSEWLMVWKDVTVGFTIAGIISSFVPKSFFETLFIGSGGDNYTFFQIIEHILVGPLAAFFTFIGSMGNIPLASLLYSNGVSYAGIIAFIFSDLVVFPVLRINAKYYGWKMSLYILSTLLIALICSSLILHYGLTFLDLLPESNGKSFQNKEFFKIDYTFFLNMAFLIVSGLLLYLIPKKKENKEHNHNSQSIIEKTLTILAYLSYIWIIGGVIVKFFIK